MVKFKAICRDENDYTRRTNTEIEKVYRNPKSTLHPFQKAKEHVRALNAVKLEKMFSKPFLFALNNHTDGVKAMAKNYTNLSEVASGGFDGQIILWNALDRKPAHIINSSHNYVKGLSFTNSGQGLLSCGDDDSICLWSKASLRSQREEQMSHINSNFDYMEAVQYKPDLVLKSEQFIESIDHSYSEDIFATSGGVVSIWNYEKSKPIQKYKTCADGYGKVKFNFVEQNLLLATAYDRSICLYDIRTNNYIHNVTLKNKSNAACWNPQEPFNFTVGNEDSNCYSFDMRNLDVIKLIHKNHHLAVLDLDYSPTGKEFVTGSFDKTLRIFRANEGMSRETYHSKRMQKVFSVLYSMDDKYVISGSDDTNIRFWKATANEPIKLLNRREKDALNYKKKLIEKHKYNSEVKNILRKKHLPKYVINKNKLLQIKSEKKARIQKNKILNSKIGAVEAEPEKLSKLVKLSK